MNRVTHGLAVSLSFLIFTCLVSCSFNKELTGDKLSVDTGAKVKPATGKFQLVPNKKIFLPSPDTIDFNLETGKKNPDTVVIVKKQVVDSFTRIFQKRIDYKTFSGKARLLYEGSPEVTANFRLRKDSVIWIHVTAFGGIAQVARLFITPDSFFMVNYMQSEAMRLPLSEATKILPTKVDFATLQNLIVGEPLRNGGKITVNPNMDSAWTIQVEDNDYIQRIIYNKVDTTMLQEQMTTHDPNGPRATIDYNNYGNIEDKKFSTYRVVNVKNGNDQYILYMNFLKYDFDQPLDYPFSIPKDFTIK